jgi:tripartite-type tricarboxylate transporter receptor subunit TctC
MQTFLRHMKMRRTSVLGAALMAMAFSPAANAEYPDKPIRFIVGFSAGGGTDSIGRSVASFIHEDLGMPGVVINKTGAGSMVAVKFFKTQKPDGYTLFVQSGASGLIGYLRGKSAMNPFTDMKLVGVLGTLKPALCVPTNSPFKTAQDVIDAAKKAPGKLIWGHSGRGSTNNAAGLLFIQANNLDVKDLPTKGGSKARGLIVSKQVDFGFIGAHLLTGFESKVRCLGLTTATRDGVMKQIPTFKEQGLPYGEVTTPMMVLAHKSLDDAKYNKLVAALSSLAKKKGFKKFVKKAGLGVSYLSPKEGMDYYNKLCQNLKPVIAATFKSAKIQNCP